jgi:hypothetical protein
VAIGVAHGYRAVARLAGNADHGPAGDGGVTFRKSLPSFSTPVTGKLRRGDAEKNAERKKKRIKSKHEDAEEGENR